MLLVPHARPVKLSDPHNDFTSDRLSQLLVVPDSDMQWHHYANILGPFLPAGTYEESVYFLPNAFDYFLANDDVALDLVTPIVWFTSEYADQLERDGILSATLDRLAECFNHMAAHFHVQHFDRDACLANGWQIDYFDYVSNCDAICQGTTDLVRFEAHRELAEAFVAGLANHHGNSTRAAWFLELARSREAVYAPPDYPPISTMLTNRALLEEAASVVRKQLLAAEPSPTYWKDTLAIFEL